MKPIIVVTENKDGKLDLTVDELRKIVDQAYDQGRADAPLRVYPYFGQPNISYPKITYVGTGGESSGGHTVYRP